MGTPPVDFLCDVNRHDAEISRKFLRYDFVETEAHMPRVASELKQLCAFGLYMQHKQHRNHILWGTQTCRELERLVAAPSARASRPSSTKAIGEPKTACGKTTSSLHVFPPKKECSSTRSVPQEPTCAPFRSQHNMFPAGPLLRALFFHDPPHHAKGYTAKSRTP